MDDRALTPAQKNIFKTKLARLGTSYTRWRLFSSVAYHATLFGSAALSASGALLPQLQGFSGWVHQKDLASVLSGSAAILITVGAAGGLSRK